MKFGETKLTIIKVITSLQQKYHKTYCWPSRGKILFLLKTYHNTIISLSCLDKHLADLNHEGILKSYQRRGQNSDGTWFNKTTNRSITSKCVRRLTKLGIHFSAWLYKHLIKPNPTPKKLTPEFLLSIVNDLTKPVEERKAD